MANAAGNLATGRPFWASQRGRNKAFLASVYVCLILGGMVILFPLYWAITTSFKSLSEALIAPPVWWPTAWHLENYTFALRELHFLNLLKNTLVITASAVVGQMLSSSLAAYGFARFRFPGRDILFLIALGTVMVPAHILIIPRFVIFNKLGMMDTYWPLILPSVFAGPFNIFLLRQFFMTIPLELDDAARIDGCGPMATFIRILLPLAKPALGIIAVFTFMREWRDFMGPLIYITSISKYTLALGLHSFRTVFLTEWNYILAGAVTVMIPPVLVFFVAQRYFIQGIVFTGVKG